MSAYSELYLPDAMEALGGMLDYAVIDANMDIDEFVTLFVSTGVAEAVQAGSPCYLAGMSGVELARLVLRRAGRPADAQPRGDVLGRSDAFWTGWMLAYYQWRTGISFERFAELLPVSKLGACYHPMHELSEERVAASLDTMLADARARTPTRLGWLRGEAGLTQAELARRSGVSLRAIQQYEQRVKDIGRAQVGAVAALAHTLGCRIEDLLEW